MERMEAFFTARVDCYDAHMLHEVEGYAEGCRMAAGLLPETSTCLLDLGCGTGLELEPVFERFPDLRVTGIDLTQAMLDRLEKKFRGRRLELIRGSYVGRDFGTERYDAALAVETLHHLEPGVKAGVYRQIWAALRPGGVYLECDYMACDCLEERRLQRENRRLRGAEGLTPEAEVHFDIPLTEAHNRTLLLRAGFARVERHMQAGDTVLLAAWKAAG